ncbi:MAG: DUF4143 domain-containing protein [Desulfovibrio sp.]|nr:DUF4143 domain-containing protein [Desulfovibrio sp.]
MPGWRFFCSEKTAESLKTSQCDVGKAQKTSQNGCERGEKTLHALWEVRCFVVSFTLTCWNGRRIRLNGDLSINKGSILENVFAQIFVRNGFPLWYFTRQKYGELDFILQQGRQCLPVEIKSGRAYKRHAALNNVLAVSEWGLAKACVFCRDNIAVEGRIRYLPWYMAMFLQQEQISSFVVDSDFSALQDVK